MICIKRLAIVVVDNETAHHHEKKRRVKLESVEGSFFECEQSSTLFAEVSINPLTRQLVVAFDRGFCRLSGQPHHLNKLFNGVGLKSSTFFEAFYRRLLTTARVLLIGHDARHVRHATWHRLKLLSPLRVNYLKGRMTFLTSQCVLDVLTAHVLVHKTLAIQVQQQVRIDSYRRRYANVVRHRGKRTVLHNRSYPHTHLVTVTSICGIAIAINISESGLIVRCPRKIITPHLRISAQVPATKYDTLGCVDLRIGTILRLDNSPRNPISLFQELTGECREDEFCSKILGDLGVCLANR